MRQEASEVRLTYEDLLLLPDDGRRHELIDGNHFVTPSPSTRHQRILTRLLVLLDSYLNEADMGQVFPAPCDVVLSEFDVVEPDLIVVLKSNRDIVTEANIQGAPDLVIEILSPSTAGRDRGLKRKLYEKYGVQEYWIVDPAEETIEIHRQAAGKLVLVGISPHHDILSPQNLPDLELDTESIFRK